MNKRLRQSSAIRNVPGAKPVYFPVEEIECPSCKAWSNSVLWFIEVLTSIPAQTRSTCPVCKHVEVG